MGKDVHPYPGPLPLTLLKPRYWLNWLGVLTLWLMGRLPSGFRWWLGRRIGSWVFRRSGKRQEIVRLNLSWCFPELDESSLAGLSQRFSGWLGRSYFEFGFLWWASQKRFSRRVRFEGLEALQQKLDAGEGVILFTLHTLSMDIGGVALSSRIPLTTFANSMRNPLLDWIMASRRGRFGCTVHARADGIRGVISEVKRGRVLFFPCDEDQGGRQADTVFAPFFGVPKSTLTSPIRLARLCRAHLMPCTTYFDESTGQYVVKIYHAIELEGESVPDALKLNRAFETAINDAPDQYLWSQRLFINSPDGLPPPYTMKGKPGSGPRSKPEGWSEGAINSSESQSGGG